MKTTATFVTFLVFLTFIESSFQSDRQSGENNRESSGSSRRETSQYSYFQLSNGAVYRTLDPSRFQESFMNNKDYVIVYDSSHVLNIPPHPIEFTHPLGNTRAYHVYDKDGYVGTVNSRQIHLSERTESSFQPAQLTRENNRDQYQSDLIRERSRSPRRGFE